MSRVAGRVEAPEIALEVRGLTVDIVSGRRRMRAVDGVDLTIRRGESIGLVGESGSGKSLMNLAILGVLPSNVELGGGEIRIRGKDVTRLSARARRRMLGKSMSLVLQDPMSALDPCFTVGSQLAEAYRLQQGLQDPELTAACVSALERLRIPSPKAVLDRYPHQLSGGMRQRVCSAIALAGSPDVLIADEPTTALDVTTQAQYLALLRDLQRSSGFALILVTHDLSIVRQMCQRVVVMYAGQIVESGPLERVLGSPEHPYTRALFDALPRLDSAELKTIRGQAPDPSMYATDACRFAPRCAFAREVCSSQAPPLSGRGEGRSARCFGTAPGGWIDRADLEMEP
jgi:oligopeptide/dipeptide ABC transporter ATP-binding protein